MMRITLIGTGRVANHLALVLAKKHRIVQVFSRDKQNAQNLADRVNAEAINQIEQLNRQTDLVIIAVSDQAISELIKNVSQYVPDSLIVHTSGSTSLSVLTESHLRAGVFYPLQTFSFEREVNWSDTPLFVEATNTQDLNVLTELANELSDCVYQYSSKQRQTLHLAAVFACNFSNYCYDMAKQIVDAESVDFNLLFPLIMETANKATQNDPQKMQTGPAMRGDQNILSKHRNLLINAHRADLENIYKIMSDGIYERQNKPF
ncbi:L-aspartate dehydrogenase [Acinetobacter venetianus]|nr:L-aspartate dehydrogenase [Acinetobacter venetianus]KXZ64754.1 L-aspartate dehydrogenase [Acinetobacter venetianus]